jgi:hypothetical protein
VRRAEQVAHAHHLDRAAGGSSHYRFQRIGAMDQLLDEAPVADVDNVGAHRRLLRPSISQTPGLPVFGSTDGKLRTADGSRVARWM